LDEETQFITSIGLFNKNVVDFNGGESDCDELLGITHGLDGDYILI